jgi:hypothetical protein
VDGIIVVAFNGDLHQPGTRRLGSSGGLDGSHLQRARTKSCAIRGEFPEFVLVARAIDPARLGISVGLLTPGLEQQR